MLVTYGFVEYRFRTTYSFKFHFSFISQFCTLFHAAWFTVNFVVNNIVGLKSKKKAKVWSKPSDRAFISSLVSVVLVSIKQLPLNKQPPLKVPKLLPVKYCKYNPKRPFSTGQFVALQSTLENSCFQIFK